MSSPIGHDGAAGTRAESAVQDAADRFLEKVDRRGPAECWPFLGSRNEHGYGSVRVGGRRGGLIKAHRLAWMIANDAFDLSPTDHICHTCDCPPCCNPAHLYRGNYATNAADKVKRGRQSAGDARSAALRGRVPAGDNHWTHRDPEKARRNAIHMLKGGPWNKGRRSA